MSSIIIVNTILGIKIDVTYAKTYVRKNIIRHNKYDDFDIFYEGFRATFEANIQTQANHRIFRN